MLPTLTLPPIPSRRGKAGKENAMRDRHTLNETQIDHLAFVFGGDFNSSDLHEGTMAALERRGLVERGPSPSAWWPGKWRCTAEGALRAETEGRDGGAQ